MLMSQVMIELSEQERTTTMTTEDEEAIVQIWSWGAGTDGQLGTRTLEDRFIPQPVTMIQQSISICRIACGGAHSIALTGNSPIQIKLPFL